MGLWNLVDFEVEESFWRFGGGGIACDVRGYAPIRLACDERVSNL